MSTLETGRETREGEIVRRRVAEASPNGDHWNDWPSELAVVKIEEFDCNDGRTAYCYAYMLGVAMGGSGIMRQVRKDSLPTEVRQALARHRPHGRLYDIESVHFTLAPQRGQVDREETRNIVALFDPRKGYDWRGNRSNFETPAILVEIGCDHDYAGEHPYGQNRGYYRAECSKCGHKFEVDSGD